MAAQVQVTSPNGGESLPGGSTQLITWTGATTPDGTLEVYYNDGVTRTLLAKLAGTARSYLWTVPTATTTTGKIEIESKVKAGTEATDQSDATFSITAPAPLPPKVDFNGDGQTRRPVAPPGQRGACTPGSSSGTRQPSGGSYLTPTSFADTQLADPRASPTSTGTASTDILWHHQLSGDLYTWFLNGTAVTHRKLLETTSRFADTRWQIRGLADFDRDGQADVLWHHQGTGDLYVWIMNGTKATSGSYLNPKSFADTRWQIRGVADFNNDGQPDLLWHHQVTGDLYVWFMSGHVGGGAAPT